MYSTLNQNISGKYHLVVGVISDQVVLLPIENAFIVDTGKYYPIHYAKCM